MWDVMTRPAILISIAAVGYGLATIAMKAASSTPGNIVLLGAIGLCLAAAVIAEVILLKTSHLGVAYIAILGAETLLVLLVAAALGEGLGGRDIAGAALVLIGAGIISI